MKIKLELIRKKTRKENAKERIMRYRKRDILFYARDYSVMLD